MSIEADTKQLQPNTETGIVVRAEKSPAAWDNVKSMEVVLKAGLLGIETPITLSQRTVDFDEEDVAGFARSE